jgi:hypothetical protein
MRSLRVTAAVAGAALALGGCHNKRPEPVPGPQTAHAQQRAQSPAPRNAADGAQRDTASQISGFPGARAAARAQSQCPRRSLLRF